MNYKQFAERFTNTHTVNYHILFELISMFSLKSHIKILDFGCGTGNYIKAVNTYINYSIYGVEPCEEMIMYAQNQNPDITIKQGNHFSIPYPNNF